MGALHSMCYKFAYKFCRYYFFMYWNYSVVNLWTVDKQTISLIELLN
jgi:hypothetical protein